MRLAQRRGREEGLAEEAVAGKTRGNSITRYVSCSLGCRYVFFFSFFFSFHDPSSISIVRVKYAKHNASDVRLSMTMSLRVPVHPFYTRQIYVPYVRYARTFARPIAFSSSSPLFFIVLPYPPASIHPSIPLRSMYIFDASFVERVLARNAEIIRVLHARLT